MNDFTPRGYMSIREALNRLGRRLFPSDWTGEEHKARRGLLSEDEWLKIKDLPPARGSGATGTGFLLRETIANAPASPKIPLPSDPSDPLYQAEYRASERWAAAGQQLRQMLEAADLEAAILDPWTGALHRASAALWRRRDAGRLIEKGSAPLPGSPNMGSLWVKDFAEPSAPTRPIPAAKLTDVIRALQEQTAAKRLTRPQQKDFARKTFPSYRITERQFNEIFRAVRVPTGRPAKSDKKV